MTHRILVVAGVLAIGFLAGCRNDGLSEPFYAGVAAPTPTPGVSPTPTPDPNDPNSDPTPTPVPSGGGSAAMTSSAEQVTIIDFLTNNLDSSVSIYVQRFNGEVWTLTVAQSPALSISETVVYQNANLVFGSTSGSVLFPDGTSQQVIASSQLQ